MNHPSTHRGFLTTTRYDGYGDQLICPRCGFDYLHQGRVTVFDCDREDDKTTTVTTVDGELLSRDRISYADCANPSDRRQGLAIAFYCEGCGGGIELTIAQNKGCTDIGWRFDPVKPDEDDSQDDWDAPVTCKGSETEPSLSPLSEAIDELLTVGLRPRLVLVTPTPQPQNLKE